MHAKTDPRWRKIAEASIDDPRAVFPLSARLSRDNGWDLAFAERVVEEYRRFCYLAVTAGREVTPSDEVDQAWHLHLLYTEHYWGPWTEALGVPLHHGPTRGGAAEGERYRSNYEATLTLYREAFGEEPPADIWTPAEDRFTRPLAMRRVDTSLYFLFERGRFGETARYAGGVGLVTATLGVLYRVKGVEVDHAGFLPANLPELVGEVLSLGVVAFIAAIIFGVIMRGLSSRFFGGRRPGRRGTGTGCGAGSGCGGGHSGDGGSGCGGCGGCGG